MQDQENRKLVLYSQPCTKSVLSLKDFKGLTENAVFLFGVFNKKVNEECFVSDVALCLKRTIVDVWRDQGSCRLLDKDLDFINCLMSGKILFDVPKNQIEAANNLRGIAQFSFEKSIIEDEVYRGVEALPVVVKKHFLSEPKNVYVELPWYKPTKKQCRSLWASGLTTGLAGGVTVLIGMYLGGGTSVLSLKNCLWPVFGGAGIGCCVASTLTYLSLIIGREKQKYEKMIISIGASPRLDLTQKKSFE